MLKQYAKEINVVCLLVDESASVVVQAVFKNYDHDKDGFISHAEFDAIAGNFPFIDSFAVLDADQ